MKKLLIIISSIFFALLVLIIILGIYKFNFTNDDIYIQTDKKIDANNTTSDPALIKINNFNPDQIIQSPFIMTGIAPGPWFFEASFPIKLYNESGQLIGTTVAQATGEAGETWMTEGPVSFKAELKFNNSTSTNGILVLERDNPSGLPENDEKISLPVKFIPNEDSASSSEKIKIKVYFNNNKLDPETSCNKVFPVEREITKTPAIARAALTELLAGVTPAEREAGFLTILNADVKIQSLTIENGVAKVDFDEKLEEGSGGSCRGAAIIAQINATLKQFPSVKNVIISVNGRSEDILQP